MTENTVNPTMDPDVKAFREADGDAVRAELLLSMPMNTLLRYRELFVTMCRRAHFSDGELYIEKLATACRARRHRGALSVWGLDGAKAALLALLHNGGGQ